MCAVHRMRARCSHTEYLMPLAAYISHFAAVLVARIAFQCNMSRIPIFFYPYFNCCYFNVKLLSENESQVQEDIGFLGAVAVTDGDAERADECVVEIGDLGADQGGMVKEALETVGLLCGGEAEDDKVVAAYALLCLQL